MAPLIPIREKFPFVLFASCALCSPPTFYDLDFIDVRVER